MNKHKTNNSLISSGVGLVKAYRTNDDAALIEHGLNFSCRASLGACAAAVALYVSILVSGINYSFSIKCCIAVSVIMALLGLIIETYRTGLLLHGEGTGLSRAEIIKETLRRSFYKKETDDQEPKGHA